MATKKITAWTQLQKEVPGILAALDKEPSLALAAAANPLLALEELGYELDEPFKTYVEDRIRFGAKTADTLTALRSEIFEKAGASFNPRSEKELSQLLFEKLQLQVYDEKGCPITFINIRKRVNTKEGDSLGVFKGLHPVIEPLLRFRQIDNSFPSFAEQANYERLRQQNLKLSVTVHIHPRLKKQLPKT